MGRRIGNCMTFLALLFALPAFPANAHAETIELRREANVASNTVRLQDIAFFAGGASDEQLAALKAVIICAAPPPAETQIITAADVVSALNRSGAQAPGLRIAGAPEIVVRRMSETLAEEELTAVFREHVARETGWPPDSFVVKPPKNLAPVHVPPGRRELLVSTLPGEEFSGSVAAVFDIRTDGSSFRKLSRRFTVEQYVKTLVAAGKTPRGQSPEGCDFELELVERSRLEGEPVSDIAQIEGMTAARTIYPGTPLSTGLFSRPPVVRRGDTASVMWAGSGFNIVTKGLVLDNGRASDVVRVRVSSKRIVKALVMDSGLLQAID